jgi:hypothetical protein
MHKKEKGTDRKFLVKAISCTNYHCVFGFLLACNLNCHDMRVEMMKLKFIVNSFEKNIEAEYHSFAWFGSTAENHFEDVLEDLKEACESSFLDSIKGVNSSIKEKLQSCLKPDYEDELESILSKLKKRTAPSELLKYFFEREDENVGRMLKILNSC